MFCVPIPDSVQPAECGGSRPLEEDAYHTAATWHRVLLCSDESGERGWRTPAAGFHPNCSRPAENETWWIPTWCGGWQSDRQSAQGPSWSPCEVCPPKTHPDLDERALAEVLFVFLILSIISVEIEHQDFICWNKGSCTNSVYSYISAPYKRFYAQLCFVLVTFLYINLSVLSKYTTHSENRIYQ